MKKTTRKAFSLIELSIVLLIIGIVIAGVTQSSRLLQAMRLTMARNQTNNSPAISLPNLVLWLETTSENSFANKNVENNDRIVLWKDINPTSTSKNNAVQSNPINAPTYIAKCFNSLPCLSFSGSNPDALSFDGNLIAGTAYTIFVVERREDGSSNAYFIKGDDNYTNRNLHLGYRFSNTLTFAQYANDYDVSIASYSANNLIPRIHSYTLNTSTGKSYSINGSVMTLVPSGLPVGTDTLLSFNNAQIGGNSAGYYTGKIMEILIYSRALKTEERKSIEVYLGKKWGIVVQ